MSRSSAQMAPARTFRNLINTDPFREFMELQRDLNRLFEGSLPRTSQEGTAINAWMPAVDIYEDTDAFLLKVELPEVNKDEVKVNLDDNRLSISGERKVEHEDKREGYHRVERSYGQFYRSFTLPPNVNAEAISAEFKDGVLRLTLPKREEAKPKQINVKVG